MTITPAREDEAVPEPTWWQKMGYLAGRRLPSGEWICLARMITTWRVMRCDEWSVIEFYCYPDEQGIFQALVAYACWDGECDAPGDWVKHRRPNGPARRKHDGIVTVDGER